MSDWNGGEDRIEGMNEALEMMRDISGKRQCSAYDTCKELFLAGYRKTDDSCTKHWNGEGLPPVGCKARLSNSKEFCIEYGAHLMGEVVEVRCVFTSGTSWVAAVEHDGCCYCFRVEMLEPIRTAEEVAVEAILKHMNLGNDLAKQLAADSLYAAIRDGKIPGVKLEDEE